jgi:hypothetical protein
MLRRSESAVLFSRISAATMLLPAVLGLWWCVAVGSTLGKSATSDEPLHIVGGASYWLLNDYRLQPENGNLPQRWCAIPLAVAGWPLPAADHSGWARSDVARLSRAYLFETGNPSRRMLLFARSFAAVWGVLVALLVYRSSRELFGPTGACLSLAFCLTDTTLLANAPLATSDACAAFFFTWSTLAIWRMLELPSPGTAGVAAVATAGLFVAKFSAPLEIVVGVILLGIRSRYGPEWEVSWRGRRRPVSNAIGLAAVAACVLVVAVAVWLAVWTSFGWRYEAMNLRTAPPGGFAGWGTLDAAVKELGGGKGRLLAFLGERQFLPEAYLSGATFVLNMLLRQSFFCGDYSVTGWRVYFPFTFLVKTPLPTLAALGLASALVVFRPRSTPAEPRSGGSYRLAPLLVFVAVYWAASVTSTLNIGHRHLLPVYPALFILLGALPSLIRARGGPWWLPWVLAGASCLVSLWSFPNYLAFFNGIVRRDEAWHCLVDSNLDWGQEHYTLEDFVAAERRRLGPDHTVYGCLFDATPQGTGNTAVTLLPTVFNDVKLPPLDPGTYCISATHLQGVYLRLFGPWTARREERFQDRLRAMALFAPLSPEERKTKYDISPNLFDRIVEDLHVLEYHRLLAKLRERTPDDVINGAILVYRLDRPVFDALIRGEPPAQAFRFPGSERDD